MVKFCSGRLRNSLLCGLAISLLAALPACTTLRPGYEPPSVTISSFRPVPSSGTVPSFEIGLRVVNPNAEAIKLRGVAYTISLAGRKLITGAGNKLPIIEGYGEASFTVTAAASLFQGLRLINDLMNQPQDQIPYEVETKLDVGAFMPAIRVREAGEFSLQSGQFN